MWDELRLGDVIDDYCVKCRRVTNHSIVSIVSNEPAKVRCRTCYNDHDYRREQIPPSKKDLKKAELFKEVLGGGAPAAVPEAAREPEAEAEVEAEVEVVPEAVPEPVAVPEPEPEPEPEPKAAARTRRAPAKKKTTRKASR
jgi:hypothetical protein